MSVFLDSADLADAEAAAELRFVSGITTNPSLMAATGVPPLRRLEQLLATFPAGPVFYQPSEVGPAAAEREARAALERAPQRVVVKLPARLELFTLATALAQEGAACAITAVYSGGQALLAHAAACAWVIPYVDRARRSEPDAEPVVRRLDAVLRPLHSPVRILAASVKGPEQAQQAVADGAHGVTVPLGVLRELARHPLTEAAVAEFGAAAVRGR